MTDLDKIDKCKNILVTKLFEPGENELIIEVCLGSVSEVDEDLFISNVNLGPVKSVSFGNNQDSYSIYFDSYISYFVTNESYDNGITGEYSGDRIRKYHNSSFIDFCNKETLGFELNKDKEVKHYAIVTARHLINVLTTSQFHIKRIG